MNKIREDLLNIFLARSKPLQIRKELETLEYSHDDIEKDLTIEISADENSIEIRKWRTIFSNWDNAEGAWTEDTLPRSEERRSLILKRLGIVDTILGEELARKIPLNEPRIDIAVISSSPEHEDWVTGNRISDNGFWASYKKQLEQKKTWSDKAIFSLDNSTTRILNHLKDPLADKLDRVQGLVVGYIQSGKTANYSALIAKAVDTGYRLIIVLSGRTDILRNQTQARLDMELTGWGSLDPDEQEKYKNKSLSEHQNYKAKFVNHNGPRRFLRLTKTDKDFDPGSIALHDTGNPSIAVLKKIPKRLKKFAEILGKSEWKSKPVLLIDDESDDGSINTSKSDITKTAKLIAEILKASDASQYIGYTATPYANVFIRPDRVEELFPRDFVISLDRPEHYMGTLETFDIGDVEIDKSENIFSSNESSFIRVIKEAPDEIKNPLADLPRLPEAIDSFILAGAIKKWREKNCEMQFKHHTMLINTDRLIKQHENMAIDVEVLLNRLYPDRKLNDATNQRLENLWSKDFLPVSIARTTTITDVPKNWKELKPFIADSINSITSQKVRIVNCEYKDDTPDFEEPAGCWAILVGGAKLSRGYTIEGLTTSYFSRKPGQLDTLVQMARWYGFRRDYSDLVRLYIPETLPRGKKKQSPLRGRTTGKKKEYRLLDAFRFGAKVEEAFRENLKTYCKDLRPDDIPPLVQYEFEDFPHDFKYLKPTAPNKMQHVQFETFYLGGAIKTVTRIGGSGSQKKNLEQLIKLFDNCNVKLTEKKLLFRENKYNYNILTGLTNSQNYLDFMSNVSYSDKKPNEKPNVINEQIQALRKMEPISWRVIMFMQKESDERLVLSHYSLPHTRRGYTFDKDDGRLIYEKPLDPNQKKISAWLAKHDLGISLISDDPETLALVNEKCGVIYIVPFSHFTNNDLYYLWGAVYPGKGKAGAYRVITTNQHTDHSNN